MWKFFYPDWKAHFMRNAQARASQLRERTKKVIKWFEKPSPAAPDPEHPVVDRLVAGLMKQPLDAKEVLDALKLEPGMKVLEIGAGGGLLGWFISKDGNAEVLSVDIDEKLVTEINNRANEHHKAQYGNVFDLPFDDDTFDVVISKDFLHVLPSQEAVIFALEELHRVQKPGGQIIHSLPMLVNSKKIEDFRRRYGQETLALFAHEWRSTARNSGIQFEVRESRIKGNRLLTGENPKVFAENPVRSFTDNFGRDFGIQ